MSMNEELFTIGENVGAALQMFVAELQTLGVRTLVDIRDNPKAGRCHDLHRSPTFTKALAKASIAYSFLGDRLGIGVTDSLDDKSLLRQTRSLLVAASKPVCLLGAPREASKCHRFRICDLLIASAPISIWHLHWSDHMNVAKLSHVEVATTLQARVDYFSEHLQKGLRMQFGDLSPKQVLPVAPWEKITTAMLSDRTPYRLELPFNTELLWYPGWLSKNDADQLFMTLQGVSLEYPLYSFAQPNGMPKTIQSKRGVARYCEEFKQRHQQVSKESDVEARKFEPWTQKLIRQVGEASETVFNNVWLNEYQDGKVGITWHTDLGHQGLGKDPIIGSLSVGATRNFHLKSKSPVNSNGAARLRFQLGHGDLLVMGKGSQTHWLHSVQPEDVEGLRFNLTFRFYALEEDSIETVPLVPDILPPSSEHTSLTTPSQTDPSHDEQFHSPTATESVWPSCFEYESRHQGRWQNDTNASDMHDPILNDGCVEDHANRWKKKGSLRLGPSQEDPSPSDLLVQSEFEHAEDETASWNRWRKHISAVPKASSEGVPSVVEFGDTSEAQLTNELFGKVNDEEEEIAGRFDSIVELSSDEIADQLEDDIEGIAGSVEHSLQEENVSACGSDHGPGPGMSQELQMDEVVMLRTSSNGRVWRPTLRPASSSTSLLGKLQPKVLVNETQCKVAMPPKRSQGCQADVPIVRRVWRPTLPEKLTVLKQNTRTCEETLSRGSSERARVETSSERQGQCAQRSILEHSAFRDGTIDALSEGTMSTTGTESKSSHALPEDLVDWPHSCCERIVPCLGDPICIATTLCDKKACVALAEGLENAGFQKGTNDRFHLATPREMVVEILPDNLKVYLDAGKQDNEDLACFVRDWFDGMDEDKIKRAYNLGSALLDWAQGSVLDDEEIVASSRNKACNNSFHLDVSLLPTPLSLHTSGDRVITIITYGLNVMKNRPEVQRHYCMDDKRIRYRLSGREAAKLSGLDEIIQARVCRCAFFATWVLEVISDIEENNLVKVACFCWKGRHRSVAAAEILKRVYYHKAKIQHLCL